MLRAPTRQLFRTVALAAALAIGLWTSPAPGNLWPSAVDRLEKDLSAADPDTRKRALSAVAGLPRLPRSRLLLRAVKDQDAHQQAQALLLAQLLEHPELLPDAIEHLASPDRELRKAALGLTSIFAAPRALEALSRNLQDSDPAVRELSVLAVAQSGAESAASILIPHLGDAELAVRRAVARGLCQLRDPVATLPLLAAWEQAQAELRRDITKTLGRLQDPRSKALLERALDDGDLEVRRLAADGLGRLSGASRNSPPDEAPLLKKLAQIAERETAESVRAAALRALADWGTQEAKEALVAALARENSSASSSRALLQLGAAARPELLACLAAPVHAQQAAACARNLAQLDGDAAAPVLEAAYARGFINPEGLLEAIQAGHVRSALLLALSLIGAETPQIRALARAASSASLSPAAADGRAIEPLVKELRMRGRSAGERQQLLELLGNTGSPRAFDALKPWLETGQAPRLQAAAMRASAQTLAPTALSALLSLSKTASPDGQAAALNAIHDFTGNAGARERHLIFSEYSAASARKRAELGHALFGVLRARLEPSEEQQLANWLRGGNAEERAWLMDALSQTAAPVRALPFKDLKSETDRAKWAEVSAAFPGPSPWLLHLLKTDSGRVRASAAWASGFHPELADQALLGQLLHDPDVRVAGNAVASFARWASIDKRRFPIVQTLCPLLDDARAFVRANTLRALRMLGERCPNLREQQLLRSDRQEWVRLAAALLIRDVPQAPAERWLLRDCGSDDASSHVADVCEDLRQPAQPRALRWATAQIQIFDNAQVRGLPYVLTDPEGLLRAGTADANSRALVQTAEHVTASLVDFSFDD